MKVDTLPKPQVANASPPKFRVGMQIGYGYRVAPIPQNTPAALKNHLSILKNNLNFGADISYYFKNNIGFGVKYNGISAKAHTSNVMYVLEDGFIIYDKLSNKIEIHFIGAFLSTRYFLESNKHCVFANVGAGYVRYKDHAVFINQSVKMTGNTAAFFAEIGYDFLVTNHLAIGFQLSVILGQLQAIYLTMSNIKVKEELDRTQRENLGHIDISLGFRFYK
jgi:outer membrane protein W